MLRDLSEVVCLVGGTAKDPIWQTASCMQAPNHLSKRMQQWLVLVLQT